MRDAFLFLTFCTTVPAVFIHPHVGVLVWAWISFMNPHRLIPWGISYDFRFALICAVVTIVAWILSSEPKRLPWKATTVLLLVILAWMSLTTLFALSPETSVNDLLKVAKILLMALVTLALMQSRERIHALVWVMVVSIGFWGVKGATWVIAGGAQGSGWVFGPPGSFFADNNELALALVMTLPLIMYLYLQSQQLWIRACLVVAAFMCVSSIVGSFSRGAFIAAAVAGLALLMRSQKRLMIGALVLVSVVGIGLLAPERWTDRIQGIVEYQEDGSAVSRLQMWGFAWRLALDRPIFGRGFDAFTNAGAFNQHGAEGTRTKAYHSVYFQMLGDHGFVGLSIYLMIGLSGFFSARRVNRLARNRPELQWADHLARMLEVSLISFAVGGTFYSLANFDLFYHLIVLTLLLRIVVERQVRVQSTDPFPQRMDQVGLGPKQKILQKSHY